MRVTSNKISNQTVASKLTSRHATIFAALGDETRLSLLTRLCEEAPCSILQLAADSPLTRQAVSRHLRVLEKAGLVRSEKLGRACVFEIEPEAMTQVRDYLDAIAQQWEEALARLKKLVEEEG